MKQKYAHANLPPPTEEIAREECLQSDAQAPSLSSVKDFMRFNLSISQAVISNLPTADLINREAEWFFTSFTRVTTTDIDKDDWKEVYNASATS
jgi:hypothetical protein